MTDHTCTCFKCGAVLDDMGPEGVYLQPNDGLAFESYGHYGSTFFDPGDGTKIEIVICDECLKKHFGTKYL